VNQLLVIAVPAGAVVNGNVPLRALFVPKLTTPAVNGQPLSDFGFQDWPTAVDGARFTIDMAASADVPPQSIPVTPLPGRSHDVWNSFFSNITVTPPRNNTYGELCVTPTSEDAQKLVGNYRTSVDAYAGADADPMGAAGATVRAQYGQWTGNPDSGTPGDVSPEDWQTPDFQRTVTMLREHPAVLIRLGLILEFAIPLGQIPATPAGTAQLIRIGCTFAPGMPAPDVAVVAPWTQYMFSSNRFLPAHTAASDVKRGIVDLTGAQKITAKATQAAASTDWSLVTFDVNGGAGRMREGAQKFAVGESTATPPVDPGRVTLPVFHSAGISLVRNGRETPMRNRAKNADLAMDGRVFTADDLTAGYRVDIKRDTSTTWTPLLERMASYKLDDVEIGTPEQPEEGQVKANAAVIGEDKILRADEVLARWNGWNLAIPRPTFDQRGLRRRESTRVELPFNFDFDFTLSSRPQTELRFGRGYLMRVRAADMAGGGLKPEEVGDDEGTSGLVIYARYEPVPPPEFAPPPNSFTVDEADQAMPRPDALGIGGSIDRLIIRSDPKAEPALNVTEFGEAHPYPDNSSRILLPPPTSMALAEQHGMLDGDDHATYGMVRRALNPPAATEAGAYNWLPDPAATGAAAFISNAADFPDNEDLETQDLWANAWPDRLAKQLVLRPPDPNAKNVMEWTNGTLVVRLEPGLQADLELSSTLDSAKLLEFEFKEWTTDTSTNARIAQGRNPMATPPRRVELIHAVRRPLNAPSGAPFVERGEGWTWVLVTSDNRFGIHRPSTGQVDVSVQWLEVGDDEAPGRLVTEQVTSLTVDRRADQLPEIRHDFGDTRYRVVTYTLTAVSRYRGLFEDGPDADFQINGTLADGLVLNSARPVPPVVLAATPSFRWETVAGPAVGEVQRFRHSARIRVEMARPWNLSGAGERLAVVVAADGMPAAELDKAAAHLSRSYRDPIWQTSDAAGYLHAADFDGAVEDPAGCALEETLQNVIAVPFAAHLDEHNNRWYADVEIPGAATSYSPFVRLALARYQGHSIGVCYPVAHRDDGLRAIASRPHAHRDPRRRHLDAATERHRA
jgi:hypothetical protein